MLINYSEIKREQVLANTLITNTAASKDMFGTSPVVDWGPLPMHQPLGGWTNGAGKAPLRPCYV